MEAPNILPTGPPNTPGSQSCTDVKTVNQTTTTDDRAQRQLGLACHCNMSGFKRDWSGNAKRRDGPKPAQKQVARNAYTPMFEGLRDQLDEHHDRRERIVKASRDITALSKKM